MLLLPVSSPVWFPRVKPLFLPPICEHDRFFTQPADLPKGQTESGKSTLDIRTQAVSLSWSHHVRRTDAFRITGGERWATVFSRTTLPRCSTQPLRS